MNLFDPARHEALGERRWDAHAAEAAIARIVGDTHAAFRAEGVDDGGGFWPIHPLDRSPERPSAALKTLYYGAAGVIWALNRLEALGASTPGRDYRTWLPALLDAHRGDDVALQRAPNPGFAMGETGLLLQQWQAQPSVALEDALLRAMQAHVEAPSLGVLWGGAGTLLAAVYVYERTGSPRFRGCALRHIDFLWDAWTFDPILDCYLWTIDLYGQVEQRLGGLHGFAGIVAALWRARALLPAARQRELVERTTQTLARTALRAGGLANWPMDAGASMPSTAPLLLVQHCIGAPGIVNATAGLPTGDDAEFDALLLSAGELIWQAGPTSKLPSLCHGTPGSGYAFLKLFARTADERWLERARRCAMHAIDQAERALTIHGQRKHSLWTGDLGVALFLHDCVRGDGELPLFEVF